MEITATRVAFVSVAGMTITAEVITGAVTAIIIMMITMVDITKNAAIIYRNRLNYAVLSVRN